jgi:hypothetical protein
MAKTEKMTEDDLVATVRREFSDAIGNNDEVSAQREEALKAYFSEKYGNEQVGRSQFVSSDVMDVIEFIKPSLMRVFASGDNVVTFHPQEPNDVAAAKQATDYVNYVFMRDNPGWEIFYTWFTDALLLKNGFVKVWWDESEDFKREEYTKLTDIEFEGLISQDDIEVIEHSEMLEMFGEEEINVHDVVIHRTNSYGRVKIENVPPDEFLISRRAKTIQDAPYCCHRVRKTLSDLREMGFDVDPEDIRGGNYDSDDWSLERESRYMYDQSGDVGVWGAYEQNADDPSTWVYWVHEHYIRSDYDSDGISELRKVLMVGDYVLENEEVDVIPFVTITPIGLSHRLIGLSIADVIKELQKIKTVLMRNMLDNAYSQNYSRLQVVEGAVNIEDVMSQRMGGIIRVKTPNAITPLPTPPLSPQTFQLLEYLNHVQESRSGVSKMSQGLNDNALTSHTTATAVNAVMSAAHSRLELVARRFAETGVKELMQMIYMLIQKHQDKERMVQLRNEWVPVRPDMWRDKMDCTVSTGIGNGNRDQQMMHLSQMMQFASQAMSGGLSIVTEKNLYNMGAALIKNMGFLNVQDFLTDPDTQQQQQEGPSDEQQLAMAEMDLKKKELEIKAADIAIKQQRLQQDAAEAQVDAQLKVAELQLEADQKRAVAIGPT